jgi:superfamily II RNA helicase
VRRAVPTEAVECWILHVIHGHSMQKIARARGMHASKVMRRVRRVEELCDDPATERALTALATKCDPSAIARPSLAAADIAGIAA